MDTRSYQSSSGRAVRKDRVVETKPCAWCGATMGRKTFPSGRIEPLGIFRGRRFCNLTCSGLAGRKANPARKSYHWRARKFISTRCATCGTAETLQVHHLDKNPANNKPENLMTLCRSCHTKWHWTHDAKPKSPPCSVCGSKAKARGLCDKHYQACRRKGTP